MHEINIGTIRVHKKKILDKFIIYPCDFKDELYTLTGKNTLAEHDILALHKMGFSFKLCKKDHNVHKVFQPILESFYHRQ